MAVPSSPLPTSLMSRFATGLHRARTSTQFRARCAAHASDSGLVAIDHARVPALVPLVRATRPATWDWALRDAAGSLEDACFDVAFTAALNGGYFAANADGIITQWQERGSGSAALLTWVRQLRADRMHPGLDLTTEAAVREAIGPRVAGLPLADERLRICEEFAAPSRRGALATLLARTRQPDGGYRFTLADADALAALYPTAFAADPFRKKAILVWLQVAGLLHGRGFPVTYDLPIPSDYQIPRALLYHGVLVAAPALEATLRGAGLLAVESPEVEVVRAAAVVAAHALAEAAHVSDDLVDNALFLGTRTDPAFQRDALPPMRCASLWF